MLAHLINGQANNQTKTTLGRGFVLRGSCKRLKGWAWTRLDATINRFSWRRRLVDILAHQNRGRWRKSSIARSHPDWDLSRFLQGRSAHRHHVLPPLFPSERENSSTVWRRLSRNSFSEWVWAVETHSGNLTSDSQYRGSLRCNHTFQSFPTYK